MTVLGANFEAGTAVSFGGTPATDVAVDPAGTFVTMHAPAHPAGQVDVVVTSTGGSSSPPLTFTFVAPPTVTSVSPAFGPVAGGTQVSSPAPASSAAARPA